MPLAEAVWPQFAIQVFGGVVSTPIRGNGGCWGSELVPHCGGKATLFAYSDGFSVRLFSHSTYVTDDRQTDDRQQTNTISCCHKRDR